MKRNKIIAFCLWVILLHSSFSSPEAEWILKKNEKGIVIYTRDIPGSDFKELKAVTSIKTPLSALVALIKDVPSYTNWVYLCEKSQMIKQVNETEDYYYAESDAPWPVSNRDVVMHCVISQNSVSKTVNSQSKAVAGMVLKKNDIVRVEDINTCWTFIPKPNGTVEINYLLRINPGGAIPSWLVNLAIANGPFTTISQMREEVKKDKYRLARITFIKEL
jgi:ribosome-associated toxin RatA of RatAB toxin-antitoxin module